MKKRHRSATLLFLTVAIFVVILIVWIAGYHTSILVAYLLAINLSTLLLYGYDKFVASRSTLRVPEKILHLLALLGGSPAALISQSLFHHKVSKKTFLRIYWLIVLFQIAGCYLWVTNSMK